MSPTVRYHPLQGVRQQSPPAPWQLQSAEGLPACSSAAAKTSVLERRLSFIVCRGAAAAMSLLCTLYGSAATGRSRLLPAALFLASAAPWPCAARGCRSPGAPLGRPLLCAFAALGCFWPQGLGGKKRGLWWSVCRGSAGHRGGDAPKVIEASSGSGTSPVLLGKSTIQQNTPLPPQTPKPSWSDALSPSCIWVKHRNGSDLARSPGTEPALPTPVASASALFAGSRPEAPVPPILQGKDTSLATR